MPEGHIAIQIDTDRLEKWADRNHIKFPQWELQILAPGEEQPPTPLT